jgi:GalNAc5-diNAcBac-PP-undecaprenol beta-1,3-glucosyltransferase
LGSKCAYDENDAAQVTKITVGVVSYNRPDLLRRALQSVTSQSYGNLEILINDNGSTNLKVRTVIDEFAGSDARIRCIFHPINQGAFFNFRSVLIEASGEYFVWLADDDYWSPEYLENLMAKALRTRAALTYGRAELVDVEISESERYVKEMPTAVVRFVSMINFVRFDTDSIFYGLFPTEIGKKLARFLGNWAVPKKMVSDYPFLEYNFVSYVFIFGLLSAGGFCNASSEKSVHYCGGRGSFVPAPRLGVRHIALFLVYALIHLQMAARFTKATFLAGSHQGVLISPFAALYLFLRRIGMIFFQRFNRFIKG